MKLLLLAASVLLLSSVALEPRVAPADIVFKNGNVYTANDNAPRAEAIAVKADRIVFVGTNAAAQEYVGPNTRVVDLHGNTVLPGFTDAHHHLSGVGQREMTLNLERAAGHGAVANSAALKLAGIDKNTPNPFGGEISKDKKSGEPNGMLLDHAQELVRRKVPPTTRADAERAVVLGVNRDLSLGWTQVQDPGGSYEDVDIFKKLYSAGTIKLRIYKAVYGPGPNAPRLLNEA